MSPINHFYAFFCGESKEKENLLQRRILQDPRTQRRRHNKATPGPWNAFLKACFTTPSLALEECSWRRELDSFIINPGDRNIFSTNNFATSRAGEKFNCDSSGVEKVSRLRAQTLPFSDLIYDSRFLTQQTFMSSTIQGRRRSVAKRSVLDDKRQKIVSESH